jgi:hypothetical protein
MGSGEGEGAREELERIARERTANQGHSIYSEFDRMEDGKKGIMAHRFPRDPTNVPHFQEAVIAYVGIADGVQDAITQLNKQGLENLTCYTDEDETLRMKVPHVALSDGRIIFGARFTGYQAEKAEALMQTYFKNPEYHVL